MAVRVCPRLKSPATVKTLLLSAGALAAAAVAALLVPVALRFASSDVPRMYSSFISWLAPPYLYLVVNGIIVSIAATSRFAAAAAPGIPPPSPPRANAETTAVYHIPLEAIEEAATGAGGGDSEEKGGEEAEEEFVISRSVWTPRRRTPQAESGDVLPESSAPSPASPLVSSRFSGRKHAKPSLEGKLLGVAVRSKKREAAVLGSVLKTITNLDGETASPYASSGKLAAAVRLSSPSQGSGGRARGLIMSPSQEELNRRVEAFIKKFNEEMRLQHRQERVSGSGRRN